MGYYAKRMWGGASGIIQDSSLKLWLDASNPLSYPGTGTLWSDLSGNGNNGTMINGVAYSTTNGGVMSFDGVDDYVELPSIDLSTTPFTIITWFSNGKTTQSPILANWGGPFSFLIQVLNNNLTLGLRNINNINISDATTTRHPNILINQFYHLAITYEQAINTLKIYINGVLVFNGGTTLPAQVRQNPNKINIGRKQDTNTFFKGSVNDLCIYDKALTAAEVNQNFQATRNKYGI